MEALVKHQAHARALVWRGRPHHHGPFYAGPGHRRVCNAKRLWRGSRKDAIGGLELPFPVGLFRNGVASVGVDKKKWAPQKDCPQSALVFVPPRLFLAQIFLFPPPAHWSFFLPGRL